MDISADFAANKYLDYSVIDCKAQEGHLSTNILVIFP